MCYCGPDKGGAALGISGNTDIYEILKEILCCGQPAEDGVRACVSCMFCVAKIQIYITTRRFGRRPGLSVELAH